MVVYIWMYRSMMMEYDDGRIYMDVTEYDDDGRHIYGCTGV